MKEFLLVALPWVVAGLCLAVLAVEFSRKRSKGKDEKTDNYMVEGMCVGMCVGMCCEVELGPLGFGAPGTGLCLGMMLGEVIGLMMPKKKQEN